MKIPFLFAVIFIGLLYIICPILLSIFFDNKKINKIIMWTLFSLFLVCLVLGVFTNLTIVDNYVLIKIYSTGSWANKSIGFRFDNLTLFDILINLIMLVPVGVVFELLYVYKNKNTNFWKEVLWFILIGFFCGFCIEFLQFVLPINREVQLSDVVFNALSCVLGGLYCMGLLKAFKKKE